ncbi:MAG: hypothetical protein M5R42_09530 [Rhodocyclaceae bacterium]|nr:hypothetical protein [Rhodocyclaceae bacterium]
MPISRRNCSCAVADPALLDFETTGGARFCGCRRSIARARWVRFGIDIKQPGFNLFV